MNNILKNLFKRKVIKVNDEMDKIYDMGLVQGRMESISELIDLHDGEVEFLDALKEVQAKNGELLHSLKNK